MHLLTQGRGLCRPTINTPLSRGPFRGSHRERQKVPQWHGLGMTGVHRFGPSPWCAEECIEPFRAECEDSPEVAPDEKSINDSASKRRIIDFVTYQGAPVGFTEGMSVVPVPVWALELRVDELGWWRPITDLGLPGYGESVDAKPVGYRRAILHLDRKRSHNLKIQPGWRELLQVGGVRKKTEHCFRGRGKPGTAS